MPPALRVTMERSPQAVHGMDPLNLCCTDNLLSAKRQQPRYINDLSHGEEEKKEPQTPPYCCEQDQVVLLPKQQLPRAPPPPKITSFSTALLPPYPSCFGRRRSKSLQRRSIFQNFWEQKNPLNQNFRPRSVSDPTLVQSSSRKRSTSCPVLTDLHRSKDVTSHLCADLSPPRELVEASGEHFRHIEELPENAGAFLPAVPYPLQRFYDSNGKLACLGGAYPLVSPRPILRQSSYGRVDELGKSYSTTGATSFNLTDTVRLQHEGLPLEDSSSKDSSSHSSSNNGGRAVHFDPRVTVTEYPDDHERKWYSENELELFKGQTVLLAQRFLIRNPHMIEKYNKPILDPITRTMRKRALFSLPVFSSILSQEGGPSNIELKTQDAATMTATAPPQLSQQSGQDDDEEVKKILIVDRNTMILELFRRSLQTPFPYARITTVTSAEDALKACAEEQEQHNQNKKQQGRCFDIVVAEERLHKPLCGPGKPLNHVGKASSFPAGSTGLEPETHYRRSSSGSMLEDRKSGCQLFQALAPSEEHQGTLPANKNNKAHQWCPLLIGVSTHPVLEEQKFLDV